MREMESVFLRDGDMMTIMIIHCRAYIRRRCVCPSPIPSPSRIGSCGEDSRQAGAGAAGHAADRGEVREAVAGVRGSGVAMIQ